jgi:phage shock protein A
VVEAKINAMEKKIAELEKRIEKLEKHGHMTETGQAIGHMIDV